MFHDGLFELEILEILTKAFFVKNYYVNYQVLQSALLKKENK